MGFFAGRGKLGLLSSCSAQASGVVAQTLLPCGLWDLPRPGMKHVFPALAGGFLTIEPPGKSEPLAY